MDEEKLDTLRSTFVFGMMAQRYTAESNGRTDRVLDYLLSMRAELCIMPTKDKILAIPYFNQHGWNEKLLEMPWVKEYGYWDNTDQPDDMSDADWEQRKIDWDDALGSEHFSGIPAAAGFTAQLHPPYIMPCHAKDVLPHIPSAEERVNNLLHKFAHKEFVALRSSGSFAGEYRDFIKSDVWKSQREQHVKMLHENLKEITVELLNGD